MSGRAARASKARKRQMAPWLDAIWRWPRGDYVAVIDSTQIRALAPDWRLDDIVVIANED